MGACFSFTAEEDDKYPLYSDSDKMSFDYAFENPMYDPEAPYVWDNEPLYSEDVFYDVDITENHPVYEVMELRVLDDA